MQHPIAQVIALAAYGIPRLRGSDPAPRGLPADNSTLQFCEHVKFFGLVRGDGAEQLTPYADDPQSWIDRLKQDGAKTLRIHHEPRSRSQPSPRLSAGFVGGGGRWLIEASGAEGRSLWESGWEIGDRSHPQERIWRVKYVRIAAGRIHAPPGVRPVDAVIEKLHETLARISGFARRQNLVEFAETFERGRIALRSDDPFHDAHHKDLVPPGLLDLEATRLLGAAQVAWVFGGMGSWNDLRFEGVNQSQYVRLSNELFELLNEGCVAAINSAAGKELTPSGRPWWRFFA